MSEKHIPGVNTPFHSDFLHAVDTFGSLPWQRMAGQNILVLGASGLVGSALVDMLMLAADRHGSGTPWHVWAAVRNEQRACQRFKSYADSGNFHIVRVDVMQADSFPEGHFHYIVNAASGATPSVFASDPISVMCSNFIGTDNLLRWVCEKQSDAKVVYISSGEVYGETDGRIVTEDYSGYVLTTDPRSCYPSSKRATETLCACYAKQHGVDISIARLCHVYGPGFTESDNRVYAQFIRNVLRGEDIVMKSTGEKYRSWLYVVDCASALLHIMLMGMKGMAYNVANEESCVTIRHLAETIASLAHCKVVIDLPADEAATGGTPITRSIFSTARLMQLGWRPMTDLQTGLQHTIEELRSQM